MNVEIATNAYSQYLHNNIDPQFSANLHHHVYVAQDAHSSVHLYQAYISEK